MTTRLCFKSIAIITISLFFWAACKNGNSKPVSKPFVYKAFKDSLRKEKYDSTADNSNIFDNKEFTPGIDSLDSLLAKMDTTWHRDIGLMEHIDTFIKGMKSAEAISPEDIAAVKANISELDSFLKNRGTVVQTSCREKDCLLYAEIIKSRQILYLYIGGELSDSFKVSTGIKKKHETPAMSVRPSGPLFTKYKSKKFPGGNYKGLGNMPYAVFIRGGYAIHGTTPGNFSKLGTRASHGCIRLHPDNARIFYELVKMIGLNYTWVSIRDSLP